MVLVKGVPWKSTIEILFQKVDYGEVKENWSVHNDVSGPMGAPSLADNR